MQTTNVKSERIQEIVAEVALLHSQGSDVSYAELIDRHPDLMPELQEELKTFEQIRSAYLATRINLNRPAYSSGDQFFSGSLDFDPPVSHGGGQYAIPNGYVFESPIRSGGQAVVFKARHAATNRPVAIKILLGGSVISSRSRQRFEREVAILASLDHPNIVKIVDRGRTSDGAFFLVMDYVDGKPIDDFISTLSGNTVTSEILRLFSKIARAVEEAHHKGIIHRDLKPSNILVDRRGEPHVLDFGLARYEGADELHAFRPQTVTATGELVGSLPWSSPEQARGRQQDVQAPSDVYSLGVMLYQAITGRLPYAIAGTIPDVLNNILYSKPASLRPTRKGVEFSDKIEGIILHALSKKSEHRYHTAGLLAEDIDGCLNGSRIHAKGKKERRWKTAIAVSLCCLGMAGIWINIPASYPLDGRPVLSLPSTTNSLGMTLVQLPPGRMRIGSIDEDISRAIDEKPTTAILDRPIFMSITEVTESQYAQVMVGAAAYTNTPSDKNLPASEISWEAANEFCRRLSKQEQKHYRLPSEAEWEYACRAFSRGPYGGSGNIEEMGWCQPIRSGRPEPVAQKMPNNWGLYDMHGNVAEWCMDLYVQNRPDPSVPPNQAATNRRVAKGGSWDSTPEDCRSASRQAIAPDASLPVMGFRVVLDQNLLHD